MLIERPPLLYRFLFPGTIWRIPSTDGIRRVYLTFDDGPIPEVTPWVLDLLASEGVKATFFCVADNVRKYPSVYQLILSAGHQVGNHTYHHLQGIRTRTRTYVSDSLEAKKIIDSPLFRPPHGHLRLRQLYKLRREFKVVMWDLVTRDYSRRITPEETFDNVRKYVRDGSIIVFHDSIKAQENLRYALPRTLTYLKEQGYTFDLIS